MINNIKEFSSNINLTGYLRDLRGKNTNINLRELTRTTKNITVQYQMPKGKIEIEKRDSITENVLTNAEFKLYEWNGQEYIEKETLTDDNSDGIYESQYYEWNKTTNGQYKVVETGIPTNHKELNFNLEYILNQLRQENYVVKPDYNNHEQVTKIQYTLRNPDDLDSQYGIVENEPYKIKASVEVLDEENLKQIKANATFKIYEWDSGQNQYKPYTSYTRNIEVQMARQSNGTYLTDEWLYYTENNQGKYRIIEEQAPYGYYGDYKNDNGTEKRTYDLQILDIVGQDGHDNETTIHLSNKDGYFLNTRTKSEIKINKIDKETKGAAQVDATLQGAEYELYARDPIYHADGSTTRYEKEQGEQQGKYYRQDELIETLQTNEQGQLTFENLECGKYYIKEKTPSVGYLLDQTTYDVDVTYRGETIKTIKEERTSEEQVQKQAFQITKIGNIRDDVWGALQHAGFTIYQISKLSIVQEGKVTKNQDGTYTLNDEQAKKDTLITDKKNSNGTYDIEYLVEYYYKIKNTGEDKDQIPQDEHSYFMYQGMDNAKVKNYATSQEGITIEELQLDASGKIESPRLAYGEYIIIETSTPKNLEIAKPFFIEVKQENLEPQLMKYITDRNFEARIKLFKQDASPLGQTVLQKGIPYVIYNQQGELQTYKQWSEETGNTIIGTREEGYYEESGTQVRKTPYKTGVQGYLITQKSLPVGTYTIEELKAPKGYVLTGYEGYSKNGQTIKSPKAKETFEVATSGIYYTDNFLDENMLAVKQKNDPQVGTITIGAIGEYIKEITKDQNNNYTYTYEKRPIQGVTYQIKARDDIKTIDGHKKTIYKKDQLVTTVTTNEQGKAYAENLPQGKYYIIQTVAGQGFTLNNQEKDFEVQYGVNDKNIVYGTKEWEDLAQKTPVVYLNDPNRDILNDKDEYTYENTRQNLEITINKQDEQTNKPIEQTTIALYTKENIIDQKTGKTLIPKDTKIYEATTDKNGKIIIPKEQNLPLAMYYIKETKPSTGYINNNQQNTIDGTYEQTQTTLKKVETTLLNKKTSIQILKTDINEMPLEQTTLEIQDENQKQLATWKTTKDPKNVQGLTVGKTYKIVETKPTNGYVTQDPITFQINQQGQIQTQATTKPNNTILMKNEVTKVQIQLLDKQTQNFIPGTIMQIIQKDEQGNEHKIDEWTTTNNAYYIEKLPIGKYIIRQTAIPQELKKQGYVLTKDQEIEIQDTKNIQTITIYQQTTQVQIHLLDKDTNEQVPGQTMQIIKKGENGQEETINQFKTTSNPYTIEKLQPGEYILRQKEITKENGYATTKDLPFKVEETEQTQKISMIQAVTKLQIETIDKQTKEQIYNIKYQIIQKDQNGNQKTIKEIEIKDTNNITERIPIGKYTLKQLPDNIANRGYVRQQDKEIEIINTEQTQKIILEQETTKLEASIIDKQTKEQIIGATLTIQDQNGKEIIQSWVSDGKPKTILRLPVGKYYLVEIQAPTLKGYVKANPVEFEIKETEKTQTVIMEQETTKIKIELQDQETGKTPELNPDPENKIIIKDENGKQIVELDPNDPKEIQKIPPGNYIVELKKPIYGYKPLQQKIQVLDKLGLQTIIVQLQREEFDIKVETWIGKIEKNGKTEYENKKQEQKIKKLDIKDKNIKTENIKITYKIRITNISKINGQVGKIINQTPSGMIFKPEDNKGYWKQENGKIISTALAEKQLKENAYTDLEIVFRWKNGLENFGTKENNVEITDLTSDIGYKDKNQENNKAKSVGVIIGVSTGDMNLVWACWILLITLILIEITVTKKLKIKKFGLKDRTLKYAKKYAKEQKNNKRK